jgi:hypothetical protein
MTAEKIYKLSPALRPTMEALALALDEVMNGPMRKPPRAVAIRLFLDALQEHAPMLNRIRVRFQGDEK